MTNSCDPSINPNCDDASIRTFDIVRNGVLKSLLSLVPENSRIAPSETSFFIEDNLEFDFCVNATVDTSARVIADTAPGMEVGICSAEGSNFFTIGFVPDFPCMVAIDLTCFIVFCYTFTTRTRTRTNTRTARPAAQSSEDVRGRAAAAMSVGGFPVMRRDEQRAAAAS